MSYKEFDTLESAADSMPEAFRDGPLESPTTPSSSEEEVSEDFETEGDGAVQDSEESEDTASEEEETSSEDEAEAEALPESFEEFAKAVGAEEEYLKSLKVKFRSDGKDVELPISEVIAGYQRGDNYTRGREELKRERVQLQTARQQELQEFTTASHGMAQLMSTIEESIRGVLDTDEMRNLRLVDPSTYLLRRDEVEEQLQQLQQIRNQAAQQYQSVYEQRRQATIQENRSVLAKALPEGALENRDPDVLNPMVEVLAEVGYTSEELGNIIDPKAFILAHQVATLKKQLKAVEVKVSSKDAKKAAQLKQLKQLPRYSKSGTKTTQDDANAKKRTKALQRLQREKSVEAAADAAKYFGFAD
ncbi:MAG: hypothetical protein HC923_00260 [Myxococcales bacterium]|nr:hypothetical protein [Myxococcales bacterium]